MNQLPSITYMPGISSRLVRGQLECNLDATKQRRELHTL